MSMNLVFQTQDGYFVEFPFQTPTNLTKSVLGERDIEKRIILVREYMIEQNFYKGIVEETIDLMNRPELKLVEM